MKNRTFELRKEMLQHEDIMDRMNVIKNKYEGETAYIVAGGPSLNNYTHDYLRDKLSDKLVMTIKQSYNIFEELCDFHLLNFCNFCEYDFKDNHKTISAWVYFEQFHPQMIFDNNLRCDVMLPVFRNQAPGTAEERMQNTMALKGDWENLDINNSIPRPWGPGTMYELAIPMALWLGVKKIVTVGWDIGDLNSFENGTEDNTQRVFQDHFYGKEDEDKIVYAKTSMGPYEIKIVAESTKGVYEYLQSRGIDWEMVSDRNPGYEQIRRIEL